MTVKKDHTTAKNNNKILKEITKVTEDSVKQHLSHEINKNYNKKLELKNSLKYI